jgi:hypothetical protein
MGDKSPKNKEKKKKRQADKRQKKNQPVNPVSSLMASSDKLPSGDKKGGSQHGG